MKLKSFITILSAILLQISLFSQNTEGTVSFNVRTVTANGNFSPKHVLAIWIKNSSGEFVRSMKVMAIQRIQYLYSWNLSSNSNTVNAVTGPTLTSHQSHIIEWNCTDNDGNILPDGEYQFWIEFTDQHAQGPITYFAFNKGTESIDTNFPDQTYFKDVSIVYSPNFNSVSEVNIPEAQVLQDPFSGSVYFSVSSIRPENAFLQIYNVEGKKIFETQQYLDNGQNRVFKWTSSNKSGNIFIYRIENGISLYQGKFIK